ncbi:hypothetical protein F5X99DRAFT_406627 [Biscogniauxia marginata]|nr:hypothetical protein F5X99DRAFT_406627 [Biscogniauxia marginata]
MACGHVLQYYSTRCPASCPRPEGPMTRAAEPCPRCASRAAQRREYKEKERAKKEKAQKDREQKKQQGKQEEEEKQEKAKEKKQEARRAELLAYFLRSDSEPGGGNATASSSSSSSSSSRHPPGSDTKSRWVDGECVWEETLEPDGARYTTERVVTALGGTIRVRRGPFYDGSPNAREVEEEGRRDRKKRGGPSGGEEPKVSLRQEEEDEEEIVEEESFWVGEGQTRHRLRGARKCAAWLGGGDGYPEDADGNSSGSEADSEIGDTERDDAYASSQETVRPSRQSESSAVAAVDEDDDDDEEDYEDIWLKIAAQEEKGKKVLRRVDNHI